MLFIIPGVVAEKISSRMDMPKNSESSEFGELIGGVLLSLPIVIVICYLINLECKFTVIDQFIDSFKQIGFLVEFTKYNT